MRLLFGVTCLSTNLLQASAMGGSANVTRRVPPHGAYAIVGTTRAERANPEGHCNQSTVPVVEGDVEQILSHDEGARPEGVDPFIELYRREYPGMVRLAHALTGSGEGAEDIVQDAFVRLRNRVSDLDSPGGYLRTTVVNLCRDRGRAKHRELQLRTTEQRIPQAVSPAAMEMMDVILRLPYRQRAVLVLRYWGDWSEAEIASSLGCRPGAVKTLASRGLARIKKEIEQ
jgi:RNA polymerase sigma factor (sigma-70 family)